MMIEYTTNNKKIAYIHTCIDMSLHLIILQRKDVLASKESDTYF